MAGSGGRPPTRRDFLRRAAGGAAAAGAALVVPGRGHARTDRSARGTASTGPGAAAYAPPADALSLDALARRRQEGPDEAFWELVKRQFPLDDELILMNAANLCPSPFPVQETVFRLTRDVDGDASFQNRGKFGDLQEASRSALAAHLGASPDEIAITRNTSEGNNTVLNGLTLGPGDEVVVWEQNHPTNHVSWDVRAERWGFSVRRISTPPAPASAEQLLAAFEAAITDRTRVLAFSHVSNVTGVALPAAALCRRARDAGILTLVDGAQSFGVLDVDLHDMGCDFYTGSAHKWFVGPREAGVLFVRRERIADTWASDVGVGWDGAVAGGARKFENLGQRDDAAVAAVATAAAFHEAIGRDLVEARVRALATALKARIRDRIPEARFHTSDAPEHSAGVVVALLPTDDHAGVYRRLYERHRIAGALRGGAFPGVRLCPHIYNTMSEIERVGDALAAEI